MSVVGRWQSLMRLVVRCSPQVSVALGGAPAEDPSMTVGDRSLGGAPSYAPPVEDAVRSICVTR